MEEAYKFNRTAKASDGFGCFVFGGDGGFVPFLSVLLLSRVWVSLMGYEEITAL